MQLLNQKQVKTLKIALGGLMLLKYVEETASGKFRISLFDRRTSKLLITYLQATF